MKYKHLAMIMGVMITATSVGSTATVFAEESKTESTQDAGDTTEDTAEASDAKTDDSKEETNENEILGEVKSVEDGKITIAVGTRKEMGQPGEQPQGGENGEAPEKPEGDDSKADGAEETDSEATEDIKLLMQRKTQKLQMAKMKHPLITQTKMKFQMVTVMARELRTEKHHLC